MNMYGTVEVKMHALGIVSFRHRDTNPGTHWTGGCVSHRAQMVTKVKRNFLVPESNLGHLDLSWFCKYVNAWGEISNKLTEIVETGE
jgi:hypothetical protein